MGLVFLIGGLILIFPAKGIVFSGVELKFVSKEDFQSKVKIEEEVHLNILNIDSIKKLEKKRIDSIRKAEKIIHQKYLDSILKAHKNIQYPGNDMTVLFPFFEKLTKAKTKKVRIMHYGDSQIEADRITALLRESLQKKFGGYGPGAYAVIPATRKISIKNDVSENWVRRTGFGSYIDTAVSHKNYGALFSFCEITSDSLFKDTNAIYSATITINRPTRSYSHCRNYQRVNIYYSTEEKVNISYKIKDSIVHNDTLDKSKEIKVHSLEFSKAPKSMEVSFKSKGSPLIYGISLEGKRGVVVDNIPLRGASGTEFGKVDYKSLKQMHHLLQPDLFILEFGGNTIPYINTKKRAQAYGSYFKKQILKIKKINPQALVLVIGPGDMAKKANTSLVTYPILEDVRDALKTAAFETNSCFWDMYLNMGGENSIQRWSEEKPALAARDYIHLTNTGAQKVANLFIQDLMNDYDNYLTYKNEE